MDLNIGLWQMQSLKLTMTQELSQAIALLQFSRQELAEFLGEKILDNPLLQIKNDSIYPNAAKKRRGEVDPSWIEQISDQRKSLSDHLLPQLCDLQITKIQKKILTYLIDYLDQNGYFTGDIAEIAKKYKRSPQEVEECLGLLQQLDPAGIGARNLAECLLLQLKRHHEKRRPLIEKILTHHFPLFAQKKWKEIAKIYSIDMKEIQQIFDFVRTLHPRPGLSFHHEKLSYITPDVIISLEGNELIVRLYDNLLPRIQFNEPYYKRMTNYHDKNVSEFLQTKRQDYQWIIRSLEQRQNTILAVTKKIVEKQKRYFHKKTDYLEPMTMKEIADELDVHESTVSRAVRGKYVQTHLGTIELKTFFTSSIDSGTTESLSSDQVKNAIVRLVDAEDKNKPLTDMEIVDQLKKNGELNVSRRTVAKYRDQLSIPSSVLRKRYD
jgi:RNA polymerase sigma-54 factor